MGLSNGEALGRERLGGDNRKAVRRIGLAKHLVGETMSIKQYATDHAVQHTTALAGPKVATGMTYGACAPRR